MKDISERYVVDEDGCWIWAEGRDRRGEYGVWLGTTAHRAVYLKLGGHIPEGLELDHLCKRPLCVNPDHLEPVTRMENMRRRYEDYTHCKNGHEFTASNTYIRPSGWRDCRTCIRERVARYKQRRAA